MRQGVVSVIIPAYNAVEYIDECISSVMSQTYTQLEIIVVDDGSTDNTLEIIRKYEASEPRIIAVTQANKGPGGAMNTGMELATGEAIMFLGVDDYYTPDLIDTVFNELINSKSDIVIFNGKAFPDGDVTIKPGKERYFKLDERDKGVTRTGIEFLKLTKGRIHSQALKIYRKDFIKEHGLRFPEGVLGEDAPFLYDSFISAQRVRYIDCVGYYRRYRRDSTMTSTGIRNIKSRISCFPLMLSLVDKVDNSEDRRVILKQYAYYAGLLWIMIYNRQDPLERQALEEKFHENQIDKVISNNKSDMLMVVIGILASLPNCLLLTKILAAKIAKIMLKGKTRFSI